MAAHPACFLTSEDPNDVRELYSLVMPLLDPRRDGGKTISEVTHCSNQARKLGKKRGWFR